MDSAGRPAKLAEVLRLFESETGTRVTQICATLLDLLVDAAVNDPHPRWLKRGPHFSGVVGLGQVETSVIKNHLVRAWRLDGRPDRLTTWTILHYLEKHLSLICDVRKEDEGK